MRILDLEYVVEDSSKVYIIEKTEEDEERELGCMTYEECNDKYSNCKIYSMRPIEYYTEDGYQEARIELTIEIEE